MNVETTNIQNREQFDKMLSELRTAKTVVVDTEANGLNYYRGNYIISISIYFPEYETAYNVPFRHGEGVVNIHYTKSMTSDEKFEDISWQGKTKKGMFLSTFWELFKRSVPNDYFGNLPVAWLEDLKEVWAQPEQVYIFHNARFDLHMLNQEGFKIPDIVHDTMLMLHLVNEDWLGIKVQAPYRNKNTYPTKKENAPLVKEHGVEWGEQWALDADGEFMKREQRGNRRLKWQAMLWGFDDAHVGEAELWVAKTTFEGDLASFIALNHLDHPYVEKLLYAYFRGCKSIADEHKKASPKNDEMQDKQYKKLLAKVSVNEKSNMWMLPSSDVAHYAIMDTILTHDLYEKLLPILERWNNIDLFHNVCEIQLHVAWEMEKNGLHIDVDLAHEKADVYRPRLEELQSLMDTWALENWGEEVNLSSPKQLLPFLKFACATSFDTTLVPDWFSPELVAKMDNDSMNTESIKGTAKDYLDVEPYKYHPVVMLLFEFRKLKKELDTYLANWISGRDTNNIVRGRMNVDGTVAGRFSSSGKPAGNLQNIPERGGYTSKQVFIPYDDSYIMFAIDYGQLEARIAAWIAEYKLPQEYAYTVSGTPMLTMLADPEADAHSFTRDELDIRNVVYPNWTTRDIAIDNGINPSDFTDEALEGYVAKKVLRQMAKTLNFGLLYSGTGNMVSKLLKIPRGQADVLVKRWRALFPAFAQAQSYYEELSQTRRAVPNGKGVGMYATQYLTGRHRKLHMYDTFAVSYKKGYRETFNPRAASARKVWNNVVQGLGGWMSVDAALRYQKEYTWHGMKLFAQVHDALDGQVKKNSLYRVKALMGYMVDYPLEYGGKGLLTVDLDAGFNWQPASVTNPNGMRPVENIDLWIETQGQEGY